MQAKDFTFLIFLDSLLTRNVSNSLLTRNVSKVHRCSRIDVG